jgi:L-cysteate sulfo-lyase
MPTGSAGTQAGLLVGLTAVQSGASLLGIGVRAPQAEQEDKVFSLADRAAAHVGLNTTIDRRKVVANCDYVGPGYGQPTRGMQEAVLLLARRERILLDPVYTGKAMAGLIDLVKQRFFKPDDTVVFIHTGGSPSLFGYAKSLQSLASGENMAA